jgi:hypothetical protein
MLLTYALAILAGAALWTFTEYCFHRFAGHGPRRQKNGPLWFLSPKALVIVFHEEHTHHHADPTYFAPTWKKALAALAIVPAVGGLASLFVGAGVGLTFGASLALTYLGYEILHRRCHTHAPMGRYFAWMRRHHLHHHVSPKVNHGVTVPFWDVAFGTLDLPDPVKLHRNLAPQWLLDDAGALKPEFAAHYQLVGR